MDILLEYLRPDYVVASVFVSDSPDFPIVWRNGGLELGRPTVVTYGDDSSFVQPGRGVPGIGIEPGAGNFDPSYHPCGRPSHRLLLKVASPLISNLFQSCWWLSLLVASLLLYSLCVVLLTAGSGSVKLRLKPSTQYLFCSPLSEFIRAVSRSLAVSPRCVDIGASP